MDNPVSCSAVRRGFCVAFVCSGYFFNGGTTFLLRLCKALSGLGVRCRLIFLQNAGDANLLGELSRYAEVVIVDSGGWLRIPYPLNLFGWAFKGRLRDACSKADHIHLTGTFAYLAIKIAHRPGWALPGLSVGVYHQYEYLNGRKDLLQRLLESQLRRDAARFGWLFFNESNQSRYRSLLPIEKYVQVPIGIDLPAAIEPADRQHEPGLIVSVGNLVPFKTYNEHVIRAVEALSREGIASEYHIYGDGETRQRLQDLSLELGVQDRVHFHGRVSYARFNETVSRARVFVGSGSAVIEAAALGVPAIIGIESNLRGETYGLLSDIAGISYNEDGLPLKKMSIAGVIKTVLVAGPTEYRSLCLAARSKSEQFSIASAARPLRKWFSTLPATGLAPLSLLRRTQFLLAVILTGAIGLVRPAGRFNSRKHVPASR